MPNRRRQDPDRAWASYSEAFRTQIIPKMLSSKVFLAIYDDAPGGDQEIRFATQLGLMLLHDKPILLLVVPGATVPRRLRQAADEVVEVDLDDAASQDAVVAAMRRLTAGTDHHSQ